jgi:hypothetical protein
VFDPQPRATKQDVVDDRMLRALSPQARFASDFNSGANSGSWTKTLRFTTIFHEIIDFQTFSEFSGIYNIQFSVVPTPDEISFGNLRQPLCIFTRERLAMANSK